MENNLAYNRAMRRMIVVAVTMFAATAGLACDFKYDPASATQYYRAEGWKLPGTEEFNLSRRPNPYGLPIPRQPIQGASAQVLSHDDVPYVVELPTQTFLLNGTKQKMRAAQFEASILRWMINDRI